MIYIIYIIYCIYIYLSSYGGNLYKFQVGVLKCLAKRCKCCTSLLLDNSYTFKNVDKTFNLKVHFTCDSSNLLYVVICPTCGEEYTRETGHNQTQTPFSKLSPTFRVTWISKTQVKRILETVW